MYGGYTGVYTRDTSAFVLAMCELGRENRTALAAAGRALQVSPPLSALFGASACTLERLHAVLPASGRALCSERCARVPVCVAT